MRRTPQNFRKTERGASEIFMIILMITMIAFAGLAFDAGMAFNARRAATNAASSAARAGAQEINEDYLYTTGLPRLEGSAGSVARTWAQNEGMTVLDVDVDLVQVYIKVEAVHQTTFLQVIGIDTLTVQGEARAMAQNRSRAQGSPSS